MEPSARRWMVGGIAAGLVVMACALPNEIQDVDPAQYADVAARMLRHGAWFALEDMSGPFINKPPLMMWSQAVVMSVIGVTSIAARIPAVIFALITVLCTLRLGRKLFSAEVGLTAALFVACCIATHLMVADPKVDGALTAMSTAAITALVEAIDRRRFIFLAWVVAGLAVLSKGPIGLAIVVFAVAPEWIRPGFWPTPTTWFGRVRAVKPIIGLVLLGATIAPFYVAMATRNGSDAAVFLLWQQGVGRLLSSSDWKNDTTPLFFTHTALWAFLPFTLLLLGAIAQRALSLLRSRALPSNPKRIVWWWLWLPFIVISLAKYRLPQYVFWLSPPAALIAAEWLHETRARWIRPVSLGLGVLTGGVGLFVLGWCFPVSMIALIGWAVVLIGVPVGAFIVSRNLPALGVVAVSLPFLALFQLHVQPSMLEFQAGRELGEVVRREAPNETELIYVDVKPAYSMALYTQRDVRPYTVDEAREDVFRDGPQLALMEEPAIAAFEATGVKVERIRRFANFHTSTPSGRFLLASTRAETLQWLELVRLSPHH